MGGRLARSSVEYEHSLLFVILIEFRARMDSSMIAPSNDRCRIRSSSYLHPHPLHRPCRHGVAIEVARRGRCTAQWGGAPCGARTILFHRVPTSLCGALFCGEPPRATTWPVGKKQRGVGPESHPRDAKLTKPRASRSRNSRKYLLC